MKGETDIYKVFLYLLEHKKVKQGSQIQRYNQNINNIISDWYNSGILVKDKEGYYILSDRVDFLLQEAGLDEKYKKATSEIHIKTSGKVNLSPSRDKGNQNIDSIKAKKALLKATPKIRKVFQDMLKELTE